MIIIFIIYLKIDVNYCKDLDSISFLINLYEKIAKFKGLLHRVVDAIPSDDYYYTIIFKSEIDSKESNMIGLFSGFIHDPKEVRIQVKKLENIIWSIRNIFWIKLLNSIVLIILLNLFHQQILHILQTQFLSFLYYSKLTFMNHSYIMQQNLTKFLTQHQSLPIFQYQEPTNPFQKRQFGKKMKKSNVTVTDQNFRSASVENSIEQIKQKDKINREVRDKSLGQVRISSRAEVDEEAEMYEREIQGLMARLKMSLQNVQQNYKAKVRRVCKQAKGRQRQQTVQYILGSLQGSVEFIIKDCLLANDSTYVSRKQFKSQNSQSPIILQQQRYKQKQNRSKVSNFSHFQPKKNKSKIEKHQKSIYQSVLQQRKMRITKRKLI